MALGLSGQRSKFAVLSLDSLSDDSEGDEQGWNLVKPAVVTKQQPKLNQKHAGAAVGHDGESRPLSKNAKKRARKKKNQRTLSESSDTKEADATGKPDTGGHQQPVVLDWEQEVRMRNQAAVDLEFHQDLEKAILESKVDAEQYMKIVEEDRETERLALAISLSSTSKNSSKKSVTLSLQEFHNNISRDTHKDSSSDVAVQVSQEPLPVTPATLNTHFFTQINEQVHVEVQRDESKRAERRVSESHQETTQEDLPRIAQLKDDVEKRDTFIEKLQKQNELLKKALKEVKQRNQSLCKILSQGEFSTKTELIEQIEELTTVKNELTQEVDTLHSALEQERSRNKSLKVELAKLMTGGSKNSKSTSAM